MNLHQPTLNTTIYTLIVDQEPCQLKLHCALCGENIGLLQQAQKELQTTISSWPAQRILAINLSSRQALDSIGLAWLLKLCRDLAARGIAYQLISFPPTILALASIYHLPLSWFGIPSSTTDFNLIS